MLLIASFVIRAISVIENYKKTSDINLIGTGMLAYLNKKPTDQSHEQ